MPVEIENSKGKATVENGVPVANDKPKAQEKAEKAERKAAPKVHVSNREIDYRAKKLKELNERNDGFEYSYINRNKDEWDLEAMGAEIVKDKDGKKMHFKGDPVVKRSKAVLDAERKADGEFSEQQVKDIVKSGRTRVGRQKKNPDD